MVAFFGIVPIFTLRQITSFPCTGPKKDVKLQINLKINMIPIPDPYIIVIIIMLISLLRSTAVRKPLPLTFTHFCPTRPESILCLRVF